MFTVIQEMPINATHEAMVVGVFEKEPLFSGIVAKWNEQLNGQLMELVNEGDLSPKKKHVSKVHTLGQMNIKRLYFVGLGKESELTFELLREAFGKLFKTVKGAAWSEVAVALDTFTTERIDANDAAHALSEAFTLATYQFAGYKQKGKEQEKKIEQLTVYTTADQEEVEASLFVGSVYGRATNSARMLVNTPSNLLTASALADYAVKLAKKWLFTTKCT